NWHHDPGGRLTTSDLPEIEAAPGEPGFPTTTCDSRDCLRGVEEASKHCLSVDELCARVVSITKERTKQIDQDCETACENFDGKKYYSCKSSCKKLRTAQAMEESLDTCVAKLEVGDAN